jgi:excisionase family DNA binding protein
MNTTTNWLTLQEAAAYARCSTVTLAREIRAGRLNAFRLASRRVWGLRVADIDRWMSGAAGASPIGTQGLLFRRHSSPPSA